MKFVLPVARADIADTYEPLVDAMVSAGHEAIVVTSGCIEARCSFALHGARVVPWPEQQEKHRHAGGFVSKLHRAWTRIVYSVEQYELAKKLLGRQTVLYGFSSDADMMRPFMDVAQRIGNRVVVGQMAYLPKDARRLLEGMKATHTWRSALYHGVRRQIIRRLTGEIAYDGPRRMWGTNANVLFVADMDQAAIFREAGVRENKIVNTGTPFMDMVFWRSQAAISGQLKDEEMKSVRKPVLLVTTKAISSISTTQPSLDQESIVRGVVTALSENLPGWKLLFKLHPNENVGDYRAWLSGFPNVTVNQDMNIIDALSISSAMLSFGVSTPNYYAELLGQPHGVMRWPGMIDAGHLENFPHMPVADGPESLAALVAVLLARGSREEHGADAGLFDGKACTRMIRVLEEMERENAWPAK